MLLKAYHMIGIDEADFFRLYNKKITESAIITKEQKIFTIICKGGALTTISDDQSAKRESRQLKLDHLVGDDQYIYLSLGKRYWNEYERTNFGFIFNAEQLFMQHAAVLRKNDFLSEYEDLLDTIVKKFTPREGREKEFTPEEVKRLLITIEDTSSDYVSPNEAYYTLLDAVEHQHLEVHQAREATAEFVRRATLLQQKSQFTGQKALTMAQQEGETGAFEILVRNKLPISFAIGTIIEGQEIYR